MFKSVKFNIFEENLQDIVYGNNKKRTEREKSDKEPRSAKSDYDPEFWKKVKAGISEMETGRLSRTSG
ncbi:MAG: hypothetical protein R2747_07645 [Pyrinomonadaceae bacterium]